MHPVIRVSLFLVFALSVSRIGLAQLVPAMLILITLRFFRAGLRWSLALKMLMRLRWFFLAILVLYGWMTPGEALFETDLFSGPSRAGLQAGLLQLTSLILMILALVVLVSNLSREELLGAIYWWCYPLEWFHITRKQIVLRLILTMETVELLQQKISSYAKNNHVTGRWQRLVAVTGYAFQEVSKQATEAKCQDVTIRCLSSPPLWEWLYPVLVVLLFQASRYVENLINQPW